MYKITFVLEGLSDPDYARHVAGVIVGSLADLGTIYLRSHPIPIGGVRVHDAPQGPRRGGYCFQDVPTCRAEGYASRADLVGWRVADLRTREGTNAVPLIQSRVRSDGRSEHLPLVLCPDGQILDPARGQGSPLVFGDRLRATIVLGLFDRDRDRALSDASLQILLDGITRIDELYLARRPNLARLYDVYDLTYQEEPPGMEDWQDVATSRRLRKADCDDLGPELAAERRVRDGIAARAVYKKHVRPDRGLLYHIVTRWPDGRTEDASFVRGMQ